MFVRKKMLKTFNKQILSPKIDQSNYHLDDRLDIKSSQMTHWI